MRYRHKCEQNLSFFPLSFLCLSLCVWRGVGAVCILGRISTQASNYYLSCTIERPFNFLVILCSLRV